MRHYFVHICKSVFCTKGVNIYVLWATHMDVRHSITVKTRSKKCVACSEQMYGTKSGNG